MAGRDLVTYADHLRALHQGGPPLVLPNAWDVASARLVARHGFPVVATSSGAVAASLGYDDDDSMPSDEAFAAIARIAAAVDLPVTADIEAGYRLPPELIAERLVAAGAAGCNIEDTEHHGDATLVEPETQAECIAALKAAARAAGVDIVVNARVDVFRGRDDVPADLVEEGIRRARLYREAGADCVYPITLTDERGIARFVEEVEAPVNILVLPATPSIERLVEMGVRRISFGGGLARTVYKALDAELEHLRALLSP